MRTRCRARKPSSSAPGGVEGDAPEGASEGGADTGQRIVDPPRRGLPIDEAEPLPPSRLAEAVAGEQLTGAVRAPAPGAGVKDAAAQAGGATLAAAMTKMQTDAPACDVCGTITVRNGTCYKCLNCGNSMGCS